MLLKIQNSKYMRIMRSKKYVSLKKKLIKLGLNPPNEDWYYKELQILESKGVDPNYINKHLYNHRGVNDESRN